MEIWSIVRRLLVSAAVIIIAFILQTSVFSRFDVAGVVPNIMIIIVSVCGFSRGSLTGLIVGFLCGLLLDIFGSPHFGMYTLIYLLIGYFNGVFKSFFYSGDIKLPLLFIGISDLIYGVLMFGILFILERRFVPEFYLGGLIFREAAYTVAVSVILYFPLYKINEWLDNSDTRSAKIIG